MEKEMLKLKNITKDYVSSSETVKALKGVNVCFRQKEFVSVLGPSGCGKTTMLRIIAGFETPDSGDVLFDGQRINDLPPYKRQVNTVFQKYALFPHLNVYENIAFGLRRARLPEEEIARRVKEMLDLVALRGFEKKNAYKKYKSKK